MIVLFCRHLKWPSISGEWTAFLISDPSESRWEMWVCEQCLTGELFPWEEDL